MMNSFFWDPITNIELVEDYPYTHVYDFSVDEIETFSVANGIIVHNTLNSFHQSGVNGASNINQGVPRIRELISVSKKSKNPQTRIYLKSVKDVELAQKVAFGVQMFHLKEVVLNSSLWYDPKNKKNEKFIAGFNKVYKLLHPNADLEKTCSPWMLELKINITLLISKECTMFDVYACLLSNFSKQKMHIAYADEISEFNIVQLRLLHKNNSFLQNDNVYCTNSDYEQLQQIELEIMNTENFLLKGVQGIESASIRQEPIMENGRLKGDTENVVFTFGTNMKQLIQLKFHKHIDMLRTYSNDIYEIYNMFGIEAAREVLKREIYAVLNNSGVAVNVGHVNLLVDSMTLNGELISMNRYGISKTEASLITLTSFEEPDEHFVNGAIYGIEDEMNSTAANILMGQLGKFGTGMVELEYDG